MKNLLLISLLFVTIITACDNKDLLPKTHFQGEIPLKPANPEKLFSKDFSIRDLQNDVPDQKYKVIFNRNKDFTTIIDKLTGDTLFQGFTYRDKKIWYFKYQLTDSTFWLAAISPKDEYLLGWPISWAQMYTVDKLIDNSRLDLDSLDSKYHLKATKENIRAVYQKLFETKNVLRYELISQKPNLLDRVRRTVNKGKNVIKNITPNMEQGYIDITFKQPGDYTLDLFKKEGGLEKQWTVEDNAFVHLNISGVEEGFYRLEINDTNTGKLLVQSEIYIETD